MSRSCLRIGLVAVQVASCQLHDDVICQPHALCYAIFVPSVHIKCQAVTSACIAQHPQLDASLDGRKKGTYLFDNTAVYNTYL